MIENKKIGLLNLALGMEGLSARQVGIEIPPEPPKPKKSTSSIVKKAESRP